MNYGTKIRAKPNIILWFTKVMQQRQVNLMADHVTFPLSIGLSKTR